jgi:hypothetical protein
VTIGSIGDACVVGALDANGNTIASCDSTGGGISLPPTCMPGDVLSAQNGYWACSTLAPSSSLGILIPIGLLVVFAIMGAKR